MPRRIKLTRYAANTVDYNNYGAYRMRVEVTDVEGPDLDGLIFIYKRNPPSPYSELDCDTWEAVAGPPQLASIPAGAPDPDREWPYFRLNYIEIDVASTVQADSIWDEIKCEVSILIDAMERLTELQAVEDVWFPSPPDDDSVASQSTSTSG